MNTFTRLQRRLAAVCKSILNTSSALCLGLLLLTPVGAKAADLHMTLKTTIRLDVAGSIRDATGMNGATVEFSATFADGTTWARSGTEAFLTSTSHTITVSGAANAAANGTYSSPTGFALACWTGFECLFIDNRSNFGYPQVTLNHGHKFDFAYSLAPLAVFPAHNDFANTGQFGNGFTNWSAFYDTLASVGGSGKSVNTYEIGSVITPPNFTGGPTGVTPDPEPSNHPTGFIASAGSHSQITTSWTDSTGGTLPHGYLLLCSTSDSFSAPADGSWPSEDANCADGSGLKRIAQGSGSTSWSGLSGNTRYYFRIYPYTNSNSQSNYKTGGTPGSTDATTPQSTGTITIIKDTVPNAGRDFAFTTTGGLSPATFNLDDDADGTLSNTQTFSNVAAGSYSVTETAAAGYTTTLSCTDPDNGSSTAGATATIDLDPGETVTCTFTNTAQPGRIVILKDTLPDAGRDFSFTTTGGLTPASFDLDDDADGTLSNTQIFNNVAAGSYSVTETAAAGYTTTLSCVDPSGGSSTAGATANIDLAPGETVTCTYTNTAQPGTIVIIEDTVPNYVEQDFSYTASGGLSPASFLLDDDGNPTLSNTRTFSNVAAGGYTVAQDPVTGYDSTLACDDPDNGSSTSALTATIDVDPGETVTCTWTNTAQPSTIHVILDVIPDAAQDFSFETINGLAPYNFSLDDDANGTLSNTQTFSNLAPHIQYHVFPFPSVPVGYDMSLECVDPTGNTQDGGLTALINLAGGETVTCTYTATLQDRDNDGVHNAADNCPDDYNPDQANFDGDAEGDACDADDDNDGTDDGVDAFPLDPTRSNPATVSHQIAASDDDSEERADGTHASLTSSDLEMTDNNTVQQVVGLRFNSVDVPPAATIVSAWIQFSADEAHSGVTQLQIFGEDHDNPTAFRAQFGNIGLRQRTQSSSDWNPASWDAIGDRGVAQRSGDLIDIVQELVNRPGWVQGNAMAFIVEGAGKRVAVSFDGDAAQAATLHISYAAANHCIDGSPDSDGDGLLDACDPDDDNDGVDDANDAFPLDPTESVDTDGDGIGNNADPDDDNDGTNDVDDDFPLDPTRQSAGASFIVSFPVTASSDDAEETLGSGVVDTSSADLEMADDGADNQLVGLRFQNVTVPPGANISGAWLEFRIDEANSDNVGLLIEGELNANPETFSTANGDISGRSRTQTSAHWFPAPWQLGGDDRAPTILFPEVIQELVNQPGWQSGNAMALIISGAGTRVAKSFDGDPNSAPVLSIRYDDQTPQLAAPQISPNGGIHLNSVEVSISCPNAGATAHFTTNGDQPDSSSPSFDAAFFLTRDATVRAICARSGSTDSAESSASFTITTDPGAATLTFERQLQANDDDAEQAEDGSVDVSSGDLELVQNEADSQLVGLRFPQVALPAGAVIRKAWVQFTTDEADSGATTLYLQGEASDNAVAFSAAHNDIGARMRTSASIEWTPAAWNTVGEAGVDQRTADISAVIQEIIDGNGWQSGNALALIISGAGKRVAVAREGSGAEAATLHVEYSLP